MKRSIPVIMSILNNQSKEFDNMSAYIISSWLLKVAHWPQLLLSQNPKNPETLGWKTIGLIPCLPYNSTFLFLVSVPQASRTVLCWALIESHCPTFPYAVTLICMVFSPTSSCSNHLKSESRIFSFPPPWNIVSCVYSNYSVCSVVQIVIECLITFFIVLLSLLLLFNIPHVLFSQLDYKLPEGRYDFFSISLCFFCI